MRHHRHGHGERRHMRPPLEEDGSGEYLGGRGRGQGHGHRRGRRGGGVLDHGDLRYVLLALIAERPRHGYELIKAVEDRLGGRYTPSPGVIYPTLTMLEELGHLRPETVDGNRKLYALTEEGAAFLAAHRPVVDAILARAAAIGRDGNAGAAPAPEIRRAVHNLQAALQIRLGRGPLDSETVRAVAGMLDRVAGEIEGS